ncbi:hypothetical protein ACFOZY_00905 [Chungangia koreensis]|uniref:Uncharacterized protein n=1 Tax=Chungangia koreensis TaxID=752657 RepID=A0ABV8X1Y0_9LACT
MAKRKDRLTRIEEDRKQEELSTLSYDDYNEGYNTLGANDAYAEDDLLKENSQWNKEFKESPSNYNF